MIHIEGMGVLGMQVAWELERLRIPFTWSDTEEEHTAWHCSTGIVYPSGNQRDLDGLEWWVEHADEHAPFVERLPYVYAHKNPPHGGRYSAQPVEGSNLQMATMPSVAVNVPDLVRHTREELSEQRIEETPSSGLRVIAHSTDEQREGYLWGWAARVRFDGPAHNDETQATYYSKKHRFNLTYAYPIPGTGQWWAGSTLLHQRTPSERDARPYLDEWLYNAPELLGLENIEVDSLEQGWRPRRAADQANVALDRGAGVFELAPEPTSGVRHGPLIVADLMERMGL